LINNASEPGRVAVFEGYVPAPTRPYGYGNNYLRIINRSNVRREAGPRRLEFGVGKWQS